MEKFILKKGDYLDLSDMSEDKKKDIYDWLIDQGNEFSNSFSSWGECIEVYTSICNRHPYLIQCSAAESAHAYSTNNRTEELLEAMKKDKQQLPEEFIIVSADNIAVRQWLKDLGYTWNSGGDLTFQSTHHNCLASVKRKMEVEKGLIVDNGRNGKYEFKGLPIITPRISVTGFDIETPNDNQEEIDRMKKNIEELQESIKKLEGK